MIFFFCFRWNYRRWQQQQQNRKPAGERQSHSSYRLVHLLFLLRVQFAFVYRGFRSVSHTSFFAYIFFFVRCCSICSDGFLMGLFRRFTLTQWPVLFACEKIAVSLGGPVRNREQRKKNSQILQHFCRMARASCAIMQCSSTSTRYLHVIFATANENKQRLPFGHLYGCLASFHTATVCPMPFG